MPKMSKPLKIMVGFDQVEAIAYTALCQSIIEQSSCPVSITPIKLSMLPEYNRPRDPKQSNEFSFSRFLVPYLAGFEGRALFMDLDMIFRVDPVELFNLLDTSKSVAVVKHDYIPATATKYLGNIQHRYPRKNWSSVMLFNCEHPDCKRLTPEYINITEALALHRFWWTHDDNIQSLPVEWNHLVSDYAPNPDAKIVHFSIGGPYFKEYSHCEYADEWFSLYARANNCSQSNQVDVG